MESRAAYSPDSQQGQAQPKECATAGDLSLADAYLTSRRERAKLFAYFKRILRFGRLHLRRPIERKTSSSSPRNSPSWSRRHNRRSPENAITLARPHHGRTSASIKAAFSHTIGAFLPKPGAEFSVCQPLFPFGNLRQSLIFSCYFGKRSAVRLGRRRSDSIGRSREIA
jgi:hypothetical protein